MKIKEIRSNYKKSLINAAAYLKNDLIISIIKSCRLLRGESWREWFDSDGNRLYLTDTRRISISVTAKSTYSDLYAKSDPNHFISRSIRTMYGIDDTTRYVWSLGEDGVMRLSYFSDDIWMGNCSPLVSGIKALNFFFKHKIVEPVPQGKKIVIDGPIPSEVTIEFGSIPKISEEES